MEPDYLKYRAEQKPSLKAHFLDFIQTLVVFAAIGTVIYLFVSQPHKVSGHSMVPTFDDNDYILTDKLTYRFSPPKRGDIVVFKNPRDKSQDFIKRIIAAPGDKIRLEDGQIFINDQLFNELYLSPSIITQPSSFLQENEEVEVPAESFIVFGDNRERSSDSREWGFIKRDEIIGKVFFRYWPSRSAGFVKQFPTR